MEIKVSKEISAGDSIVLGLTPRQLIFALLAVTGSAAAYMAFAGPLGSEAAGWISILLAAPPAAFGFLKIQDMPLWEAFFYALFTFFCRALPDRPRSLYEECVREGKEGEVFKLEP